MARRLVEFREAGKLVYRWVDDAETQSKASDLPRPAVSMTTKRQSAVERSVMDYVDKARRDAGLR